jgi:hypothetical protein
MPPFFAVRVLHQQQQKINAPEGKEARKELKNAVASLPCVSFLQQKKSAYFCVICEQ